MLKVLIFFIFLILISCDSKIENENVYSENPSPKEESFTEVRNFITSVNKDEVKVKVSAELLTKNLPKVTPFTPFEAEYVLKLINVKFEGQDSKNNLEIVASYGITTKDYDKFRFYNIKKFRINNEEKSQQQLKGKKIVIFIENNKIVVSVEPI